MLFVGTACALSGCNHHDFLPIRCDLCSETFCFDHFRPVEHKCAKFDPTKADRVAPSCPLCSTPITIPIGQDPNAKMDAHIRNECPSTGNKAPTGKPRCPAPRCNKVLIAPIGCDSCGKSFCPSHRFPKQHSCAARSTNSVSRPSPTPSPQPQPTLTRLTDKLSNVNIASLRPGQSGPAAAAATAAMSREAVSAKPKPTPVMARSTPAEPAGPSSNKPSVPNPFNKTDRCDPHLPFSANADVAPAADKRPASIDTSFRPPSIF